MSSNPWEQILQKAIGSAVLVEIPSIEAHEAWLLEEANKLGVTAGELAEKYVDAKIESGDIPFPISLYKPQLVKAVNSCFSDYYNAVPRETSYLYELIVAWAKEEATKLGA